MDDAATARLADIFGNALHGHVTVAAYVGTDEAGFARECKAMLNGFAPFTVDFCRIEVLEATSIIVATPAESAPLKALHSMVTERFGGELDKWTSPDLWYPHTTLYYDPDADLAGLCKKAAEGFEPFTAAVNTIEFSHVDEAGKGYEIVDRVMLGL